VGPLKSNTGYALIARDGVQGMVFATKPRLKLMVASLRSVNVMLDGLAKRVIGVMLYTRDCRVMSDVLGAHPNMGIAPRGITTQCVFAILGGLVFDVTFHTNYQLKVRVGLGSLDVYPSRLVACSFVTHLAHSDETRRGVCVNLVGVGLSVQKQAVR
jgi:hypothetical protein